MPPRQSVNASLEGFESPGKGISIYKPATVPLSSTKSPSLIILATWFSALPRHVAKFTSTYKNFFPNTAILLLSTAIPEMVYRPYSTQQNNLGPALPFILEYTQEPDQEILFHIFSNSGAHTACQLARAYKKHTGTGLKLGALIIDSAPGINTYQGITDGFIGGLPSTPILKQFLSLVVYGLVGIITVREMVTGEDHFIQRLRKDLNDDELFHSDRGRVYIYSKGDKIVGWRDVESHAEEAKGMGLGEVRVLLWEKSGHVGHMSADGKKYWDVVRDIWDYQPPIESKL